MVAISPPDDPDDLRRVLGDDVPISGVKVPAIPDAMPWHLREQRAYLAAQARTRTPHHHG